jgi:hypothetical protein
MLVNGLLPKVYQLSYISFGFVMMTLCMCVGRRDKHEICTQYATLAFLMDVQIGTCFNQIEVVALEEVGFLLLEKPRCLLVN